MGEGQWREGVFFYFIFFFFCWGALLGGGPQTRDAASNKGGGGEAGTLEGVGGLEDGGLNRRREA